MRTLFPHFLWLILAWIAAALVAAQFPVEPDLIHRKFPPGHAGFPGLFLIVKHYGWPWVFYSDDGLLDLDGEPSRVFPIRLAGNLALSTLVLIGAARGLTSLRMNFGLATLLTFIASIAVVLAISSDLRAPNSPWICSALTVGSTLAIFATGNCLRSVIALALKLPRNPPLA